MLKIVGNGINEVLETGSRPFCEVINTNSKKRERMSVLVTGVAGFIGYHLASRLIDENIEVIGVDNMNGYYSVQLKKDRVKQLQKKRGSFTFYELDISDKNHVDAVFHAHSIDVIYQLAAQAGVRFSIERPDVYIQSNLVGFYNILEASRNHGVKHLIFASSSSVYGDNAKIPYLVSDQTDHPVSLYAATKKANEVLAYSYAHLYEIPTTGLRFFTVYGPWGRPDMAYYKFTEKIMKGEVIDVYNGGDMYRDFTYVDDIVEALYRLKDVVPKPHHKSEKDLMGSDYTIAPYRLYNIGNNRPVNLMEFIRTLERALGKEAKKNFKPMQQGDVYRTWADCSNLYHTIGFEPSTPIQTGIEKFVEWYQRYYNPKTYRSGPEKLPVYYT